MHRVLLEDGSLQRRIKNMQGNKIDTLTWKPLHQKDSILDMINREYSDTTNEVIVLGFTGWTLLHCLSSDARRAPDCNEEVTSVVIKSPSHTCSVPPTRLPAPGNTSLVYSPLSQPPQLVVLALPHLILGPLGFLPPPLKRLRNPAWDLAHHPSHRFWSTEELVMMLALVAVAHSWVTEDLAYVGCCVYVCEAV